MKKIYVVLLILFSYTTAYSQRVYEASLGLSPAIPIGALSDYVKGGWGFNLGVQTEIKGNIKGGGEVSFHKLRDGYDYNSFFSISGFVNTYFDTNYKIEEMPIKPYLGIGLGLYQSQYYDYFFGEDPSAYGVVISPRGGIRLDLDKLYIAGEGRLHIATGYADSYLPLVLHIGFKF